MPTETSTYPLRLPVSIKAEAERLAASEGISLNQFLATAVAEKIAAFCMASYFSERRGRADWEAFDRFMARDGGEAPSVRDELLVPQCLKSWILGTRLGCAACSPPTGRKVVGCEQPTLQS